MPIFALMLPWMSSSMTVTGIAHTKGGWYSAVDYNGPWGYIAVASVPAVFLHLPADYRAVGYQRIPYADLHRNWRAWQRDRYWEHHAWGRNDSGRGREMGRHEVGTSTEENGVDPLCIGRWVLLLDTKSIMPPLMDTWDMPDSMNRRPTPRAPSHGNEHGRGR